MNKILMVLLFQTIENQHLKYFDEATGKYNINKIQSKLEVEPENIDTGDDFHDDDDGIGADGWTRTLNSGVIDPVNATETQQWLESSSGRFKVEQVDESKKGAFHMTIHNESEILL